MLQWLYTYVANVCSQCFICVFRRMLQECLSECCICFTHMLEMFYVDVAYVCNGFKCFFRFFASVSDASFKCFICLHTYIASIVFGCFKSRSGVASPSLPRCLLVFCYLASFSDYGGGAAGPGDGGTDKRALSPSLLHGQGRDTTSLVCYCEQPEIGLM
jgi:hypothetical protein